MYNFDYCVAKLPVLRSTLPENSTIDAGFNSKDIALKYALRISYGCGYTYVFKDNKAIAVVTPQGTVSYFEKD